MLHIRRICVSQLETVSNGLVKCLSSPFLSHELEMCLHSCRRYSVSLRGCMITAPSVKISSSLAGEAFAVTFFLEDCCSFRCHYLCSLWRIRFLVFRSHGIPYLPTRTDGQNSRWHHYWGRRSRSSNCMVCFIFIYDVCYIIAHYHALSFLTPFFVLCWLWLTNPPLLLGWLIYTSMHTVTIDSILVH